MLIIVEEIVSTISFLAIILWFAEDEAWYYAATIAAAQWFYVGDDIWHHNTLATVVNAGVGCLWTLWAYQAWKNRKNRKKRKLLSRAGYKGRAALLKLVKSMPKPALPRIRIPSPVPG
jgi:hypothetical protein